MKKKRIILIVLLVITVIILIILGIINNYKAFHFTNKLFFGKKSSTKLYDEEYEDVDTIYIDVDQAIINIENSDDPKVHVKVLSNNKNIKLKEYHKKLSITVENYDGCFLCKMNVINITAPESFKEYINVSNNHGHVTIAKFPYSTIAVTNRFGNVKVGEAKVIKVISRRGSIDIGKAANVSIYSFWGTLDLDEANTVLSKSTLLDMRINYIKKYVNIENDFGDVLVKKADIERDSQIVIGFGDIDVKKLNETTGKLKKKN